MACTIFQGSYEILEMCGCVPKLIRWLHKWFLPAREPRLKGGEAFPVAGWLISKPNYSDITSPLTDLTKKGVLHLVQWNEPCEQAFWQVKVVLCVGPLMHSPDFFLHFVMILTCVVLPPSTYLCLFVLSMPPIFHEREREREEECKSDWQSLQNICTRAHTHARTQAKKRELEPNRAKVTRVCFLLSIWKCTEKRGLNKCDIGAQLIFCLSFESSSHTPGFYSNIAIKSIL